MKKRNYLALATVVLLTVSNGVAQAEEIPWLDEVVITATRVKEPIQNVPASVNVVTADDIKKKNVTTITEAIAMLPGVFDGRLQGMSDTASGIQIRGYDEKDILVLYDGMPLNDGYGGSVNWSAISIDDVEKIEVVRGAASSLYGGRAVGAVINIISKNPDRDSYKVYGSYGSNNTWKRGVNISKKLTDKWSMSFGYENKKTDGYLKKFARGSNGNKQTPGRGVATGMIPSTNTSGSAIYILGIPGTGASEDNTYNFKLKYKMSEDKSLTYRYTHDRYKYFSKDPVSYMRDENGNEVFSGSVLMPNGKYYDFNESNFTDYLGRRSIDIHALQYKDDKNLLMVNAGLTDVKDNGYATGSDLAQVGPGNDAKYPNKSYKVDLQKQWILGKNTLVAGFDVQKDSMDYIKSTLAHWGDRNSVSQIKMQMGGANMNLAAFVQNGYKFNDQWTVYTGLRLDHYRKYDGYYRDQNSSVKQKEQTYNEISPKLSLEYKPDDRTTYFASYGHSFNPPTLYQMYRHDPNYGYIANPNLDPESTNTFELGLKKKLDEKTSLNVSTYYSNTKDLIAVKTVDGGTHKQYVNIDRAKRLGAELELTHKFNDTWSSYFNYSYIKAEDGNGERIHSIPKHTLHAGIQYNKDRWNSYLDAQYVSDRNEPGYIPHRLYSYDAVYTLNWGLNYELKKGATVGVAIDNLLDKKNVWNYQRADGREYTVTFSYEF